MKDIVEYLIKHLVDKPEEIKINEIVGERTTVCELRVSDGDMGKVIGRRGQTARSLRTILTAVAAKHGRRFVLELLEVDGMQTWNSRSRNAAGVTTAKNPVPESQSNAERRWQDDGGNNCQQLLRRWLFLT